MSIIEQMLAAHPAPSDIDATALRECIEACLDCAPACSACADACLGERSVADLVHCIRLNLDCADVCEATARILSRQTASDLDLLRAQVEACAQACRSCGDECGQHGEHMRHCQICADACRRCEQACRRLLDSMA